MVVEPVSRRPRSPHHPLRKKDLTPPALRFGRYSDAPEAALSAPPSSGTGHHAARLPDRRIFRSPGGRALRIILSETGHHAARLRVREIFRSPGGRPLRIIPSETGHHAARLPDRRIFRSPGGPDAPHPPHSQTVFPHLRSLPHIGSSRHRPGGLVTHIILIRRRTTKR